MRTKWRTVVIAVAAMACGGCASTVAYSSGTASSLSKSGPLSLRLDAPAVVAGGQPVQLRLVLTNISRDTVMVVLPDVVPWRTDYQVYRWSHRAWHKLWHRGGEGAALMARVAPNDSLVFTDKWPQITNHRVPVGPGKYTIIGTVYEAGVTQTIGGIVSAPVQVRVR